MVTHLRARRESEGASPELYAARIGVSIATYRPIESGRTTPTERVAKLIEAAFGESASVLLAEVAANA